MIQALREKVRVLTGGRIEITASSLPEGAAAEVIVLIDAPEAHGAVSLRTLEFTGWPCDSTFNREALYGDDGR